MPILIGQIIARHLDPDFLTGVEGREVLQCEWLENHFRMLTGNSIMPMIYWDAESPKGGYIMCGANGQVLVPTRLGSTFAEAHDNLHRLAAGSP